MKYEVMEPLIEGGQMFIKRINVDETESWIPIDEDNADYQTYLAWQKEQETK